jgi:hypothetical protein
MILLTATWSLGFAALAIAVATLSYLFIAKRHTASGQQASQVLLAISTTLLWTSLAIRIIRGHGWAFDSPADLATGIALLLLALYIVWSIVAHQHITAWFVSVVTFALLSYALVRQPPTLSTMPYPSPGIRAGTMLNLVGGALLALAAATSLATLIGRPSHQAHKSELALSANDRASEAFVRVALFCLAASLAIDTWWLQKVGLGNANDAQQAGIAVTWMVYFIAIRLRAQSDWKGWPWTAIVTVGFGCTLPILLNLPWLETTLAL